MFHDKTENLALFDDVKQFYAVVSAIEGHEYFNFPVDFPEFDCIEMKILGLSILTTHFSELLRLTDSNTSEYFPRPILRSQA